MVEPRGLLTPNVAPTGTTPGKVTYQGLVRLLVVREKYGAAMDHAKYDFVTAQLAACD